MTKPSNNSKKKKQKKTREGTDALRKQIVTLVAKQYLNSAFNGLPIMQLMTAISASDADIRHAILRLLKEERLTAEFGDRHPNPHIMAFPPEDSSEAIAKLKARHACCLYPSSSTLSSIVNAADYMGRPYSLMLALGRPQLEYIPFRSEVLDIYRADPRFYYEVSDIGGTIHVRTEHSESVPEAGTAYIQSYGFSFDKELNRAVAVCLWDLHTLIPAQQQLWRAFQVEGEFRLHPAYFQSQVLGEWPDKISICDAFFEELGHINSMCSVIGWPNLFRLIPEERPKNFGFLLRTTTKEFEAFVHLLDKLLSDNINKEFFASDLELFRSEHRKDGSIVEVQKGTIQLLEEWLKSRFRPVDTEPLQQLFTTLRHIRKLRQKPAHAVEEDRFDPHLYKQQRELINEAYTAVRTLRLILANHPKAKGYTVSKHLHEGRIWDF
jgi:hypothetical protein